MSVPLSLRLCCVAAMAPALTETTGQSRLQLPGSPPPVVSAHDNLNGGLVDSSLAPAALKTKVNLVSDKNRGLLTQIHRNGYHHRLLTEKVKQSLKDFGLPTKISQELADNSVLQKNDRLIKKEAFQKMNQPSNGTGPNASGRQLLKQCSVTEDKALNGHTNNHNTSKLNYSVILKDKHGDSKIVGINNVSLHNVKHSNQTQNMCQTTDSGSGIQMPNSSGHVGCPSDINSKQDIIQPCTVQSVPIAVAQEPIINPAQLSNDALKKQHALERKSQFLLRRIRRLQGHQLDSHVKAQLKAFIDYQHQHLQTVASRAIRPFSENAFFNSSDVKNLSTSNLVTLVRKLQAAQPKLALDQNARNNRSVLHMEPSVSSETERKSGLLRTNVRHWNDAVDCDETESSSGGESCEEWEDCPVMSNKKLPTPLYKRAEWKWSVDRSGIVARWTWLQAQVSDLEYRIRQQSEIYKTIRNSKGVVTLSDPPVPQVGPGGDASGQRLQETSPANVATLMINVNKQASKLKQSLGTVSPLTPQGLTTEALNKNSCKSMNGYVNSSLTAGQSTVSGVSCDNSSVTVSPDLTNQALDASCVAARCRPVKVYRKRKLLRTAGLHHVNTKAARLSSVKCQCYPPVMPCPMCGGRYNNVQQLDAEGMPIMEKVSLLDPAFHPVLSFPQEIGLPLHFEALLKSGEWQSVKSQPKHTLRSLAAEKRHQKLINAQLKDQVRKKRKYNKTPAAVLLSSAKLRSKYDGKSPSKTSKKVTAEARLRRKELKRRRAVQLAAALKKANGEYDLESGSSHTASPSPQMKDGCLSHSASSSTLKDMKEARKKRFENAYDINNIVIPYSMASSTRVEKLKYKEIQTPKWRELSAEDEATPDESNKEPMETDQQSTQEEVEDMSDEAFLKRHEESETEERKRIRNFITYPPVRRSRLSRESESMDTFPAESPISLHESTSQTDQHAAMLTAREEGRRRSGSTASTTISRRGSFLEDYTGSYLRESFDREIFEPFPPRQFPLSDELYDEMKKEQLTVGRTRNVYHRSRTVRVQEDTNMEFISPEFENGETGETTFIQPESPVGSAGSVVSAEDDNDPEWNESRGDRRSSLSMRHSKR